MLSTRPIAHQSSNQPGNEQEPDDDHDEPREDHLFPPIRLTISPTTTTATAPITLCQRKATLV